MSHSTVSVDHFRDVPPANLLAWYGKTKLTQQKHTFTSQKKCTTTQNKHKRLKPGLVVSYDIRPGNGAGLFWFWHFINLSLTYLPRYLPTYSSGTHTEPNSDDRSKFQDPSAL